MVQTTIGTCEFEQRMVALCLGGVGPGLPRRQRDRHILLKSVALVLGHGRAYTEAAMNRLLESWLAAAGPSVRLDHVSLRRYLIDQGYVLRDSAGDTYRVCPSQTPDCLFEPAVDDVNPLAAVRAARVEREERRRSRLRGSGDRRPR